MMRDFLMDLQDFRELQELRRTQISEMERFALRNIDWDKVGLYLPVDLPEKHECIEGGDMDGSWACFAQGHPCDSSNDYSDQYDTYGMSCMYADWLHPRENGKQVHCGLNPLPGPGSEPQYVEWTGGGYCAGDPLPANVVRHLGPDFLPIEGR